MQALSDGTAWLWRELQGADLGGSVQWLLHRKHASKHCLIARGGCARTKRFTASTGRASGKHCRMCWGRKLEEENTHADTTVVHKCVKGDQMANNGCAKNDEMAKWAFPWWKLMVWNKCAKGGYSVTQ